jgi:hypothetical protein
MTDRDEDDLLRRLAAEQLAFEREQQSGVVTYAQLIDGGWTWPTIRRALRRHELARLHPRVYVGHTGPPTPLQRAWAAILACEPAALCGPSAYRLDEGPVHVAVERNRRQAPPEGVVLHHVTGLAGKIRAGTAPPRLAFEHNLVLLLQAAQSETDVVALLAEHVGRRGVTAAAVRRAVTAHPRLRRRRLVLALLGDIEGGVESVLEHGYLTRVERAHRLPRPDRQSTRLGADGVERQDVRYDRYGVVIELDGRLNHGSWQAGNVDAARDLLDQREGRVVVRLRWQQVMVESCATAAAVATILRRGGWTGDLVRCPVCPDLPSATVTG